MTIWWLVLVLAAIGAAGIAFIWLAVRLNSTEGPAKNQGRSLSDSWQEAAEADVEHIFNDDFREELRNRGRLHFENIISESAMFLQQDLRLTTSQLNDYMKTEIVATLKQEFSKYEQSIDDAKEMAISTIQKTNQAIEEQRKALSEQVQKEVADAERLLLEHFEANMADIVNHYVLAVVGDKIDLNDQLDYILSGIEEHKVAIIEDIKNGA